MSAEGTESLICGGRIKKQRQSMCKVRINTCFVRMENIQMILEPVMLRAQVLRINALGFL